MRLGQMLVLFGLAACTDVHGGAVELSWTLRPESGDSNDLFVNCDTGVDNVGPVARMRLDWTDGTASGSASWKCTDYHGVTGFELPVGTALLTVTPECETMPAGSGTFIAPAPLERDVTFGDTVNLGALEIFVEIGDGGRSVNNCTNQPCICQ